MALPLQTLTAFYEALLSPIPQLHALGVPLGWLDILGSLRFALAIKQIKYDLRVKQAGEQQNDNGEKKSRVVPRVIDSDLNSVFAMLVVVYAGEAAVASFTSQPPSFFTSKEGILVISSAYYFVKFVSTLLPDLLPSIPALQWEIPLSVIDGLTRSVLLCSVSPAMVLKSSSPKVSDSSIALMFSSMLLANLGFFIVNSCSMLSPAGWGLTTPPELLPYGWTSLDIISAPLITALFATLTHSQPRFKSLHQTACDYGQHYLGMSLDANSIYQNEKTSPSDEPGPFSEADARTICAVVLSLLFVGRSWKNLGQQFWKQSKLSSKIKTQ